MPFLRRHQAFSQHASSQILPIILAVMVYLSGLVVIGAMILDSSISRWSGNLQANLTIQLGPLSKAGDKEALETIVKMLDEMEGVDSARALPLEELEELLVPWIGGDVLGDIPMPRLIDVRLEPGAKLTSHKIMERLAEIAPNAGIDDHSEWINSVLKLGHLARVIAVAVVGLILFVAVVTVALSTQAYFAVHKSTVEIMHVIGASDRYIANQFGRQALTLGIFGSFLGMGLTLITFTLVQEVAADATVPLIGKIWLTPLEWITLGLLPCVVTLVSMITIRLTIFFTLARLY